MFLIDILLVTLTVLLLIFTCSMVANIWLKVPYVPTEDRVVKVMVDHANLQYGNVVYDLGAGDGRVLIAALNRIPSIYATAVEAVFTVYFWGRIKTRLSKKKITWKCGSLFKQDVSDADVIFLYLFPSLMKKLEKKFDEELKSGTRIVSHAFQFPNRKPIKVIEVPCKKRVRKVYVYEW